MGKLPTSTGLEKRKVKQHTWLGKVLSAGQSQNSKWIVTRRAKPQDCERVTCFSCRSLSWTTQRSCWVLQVVFSSPRRLFSSRTTCLGLGQRGFKLGHKKRKKKFSFWGTLNGTNRAGGTQLLGMVAPTLMEKRRRDFPFPDPAPRPAPSPLPFFTLQ